MSVSRKSAAAILIVEDDRDIADTLAMVLRSEGHEVATAENGVEGLERLRKRMPDLVLLDIMMPVMDGREFCRRMRADPAAKDVPIILMSAVDGADRGACDWVAFVRKPFDLDFLLRTIDGVLNGGTAKPRPREPPRGGKNPADVRSRRR